MNVLGIQLTGLDEFLYLSDADAAGCRDHRVEISCSLAEHEIAPRVTFPRFYKREVTADPALHHVHTSVELARLLSFGYGGAHTRWRKKGWNASPARSYALGKGS